MLKRIELWNFLSYKHVVVDNLHLCETISIVGDNGHGKSALLESVYYARYGKGRSAVNKLARENGDGSMKVEVEELTSSGKTVFFSRGRDKNGVGFAYAYLNNKKTCVARGSAVERWVEEFFGVGSAAFLLTSFFGLGASDSLVKVRPSARLETLQDIANVSIYSQRLHPAIKKKLVKCKDEMSSLSNQAETLEPYTHATELKDELKENRLLLKSSNHKLDELYAKQSTIVAELDCHRAFLKEKDSLQIKKSNSERLFNRAEAELKNIRASSHNMEQSIDLFVKKSENYKELLKDVDIVFLKTKCRELTEKQVKYRNDVSLRDVATQSKTSTLCPLCKSKVVANVREKWLSEKKAYEKRLASLTPQIEKLEEKIDDVEEMQQAFRECRLKLKNKLERHNEEKKHIEILKVECTKMRAELARYTHRFVDVSRKLGGVKIASEDVNLLSKKIAKAQETVGSSRQKIEDLKEEIDKAIEKRKTYLALRRQLRDLKKEILASNVVVEAFSRYGIPVNLMRGLCKAIEQEATAVFSQFDAGCILVLDVEDRGKPGIEFALRNRTGTRFYNELSDGQKIMLFLSVRLAIAKIIMQARSSESDFLVLDEITSHLSENKREDLVRLISEVLKRSFSQVVMVSQSPIRNIFSKNIFVEMVNDTSSVKV